MRPDSQTVERVVDLVRSVAKIEPEVPIGPETHLVDDLGVDSLDLVSIFLEVQDVFGVTVSEDEIPGLHKVGDLARYLRDSDQAQAA
jgi:acyl carrier protein